MFLFVFYVWIPDPGLLSAIRSGMTFFIYWPAKLLTRHRSNIARIAFLVWPVNPVKSLIFVMLNLFQHLQGRDPESHPSPRLRRAGASSGWRGGKFSMTEGEDQASNGINKQKKTGFKPVSWKASDLVRSIACPGANFSFPGRKERLSPY